MTNQQNYSGHDRRNSETILSMMREQINATAKSLQSHVNECSKMQKRVLIVGALILIWLIAHSPEAAKLIASAFPTFGAP